MPGQSIRPSQFITTYGPGSIIEGTDGPRVIRSLERSRVYADAENRARVYDITHKRLSETLLEGAGIVRLPTNAERGVADATPIYQTVAFPSWSLCVAHRKLYKVDAGNGVGCPKCPRQEAAFVTAKAHREAIRFVIACPEGHLDDVDWNFHVHRAGSNCRTRVFDWIGSGGALHATTLRCGDCPDQANLGSIFASDHKCWGRLPETGLHNGECSLPGLAARMTQRGASNLRVVELLTALTITEADAPLAQLLQHTAIAGALIGDPSIASRDQLLMLVRNLARANLVPATDLLEVEYASEEAVTEALTAMRNRATPSTLTIRAEEFAALRRASSSPTPTEVPGRQGGPPALEVLPAEARIFALRNGMRLRVTPVTRLQVTVVQRGYRRLIGKAADEAQLVGAEMHQDGRTWYPGIQLHGEGVFLELCSTTTGKVAPDPTAGMPEATRWSAVPKDEESITREQVDTRHPLFVWWHSFAHRLINALSIDSGYSSSSIRERVFLSQNGLGEYEGGVLLYAVQPGGDGTLGGLTSLVPAFDRVLRRAMANIDACSNDPLCGEQHVGPDRKNGAACYACLLVSETSCEFWNRGLDRNLLVM